MAAVTARSKVVYTRNFGKFARECEVAASKTADEVAKEGAKASRKMAPVGAKRDRRPGHTPLKRSIKVRKTGKARAEWYSTSAHALHVEFGTAPHFIIGNSVFFWENKGGWFVWNNPRYHHWNWDEINGVVIDHPGAKAQPFLIPAYDAVAKRKAMSIAKRNFPG